MEYVKLALALLQAAGELGAMSAKLKSYIQQAQAEGRDDILPEQLAELRAQREEYKAQLDAEIERLLAEEAGE